MWADFEIPSDTDAAASIERRPAVVVSPLEYNMAAGLVIVCPISTRLTGYPFDVVLPYGLVMDGVVISDQVRSIDWRARHARVTGRLDPATMREVLGRVRTLLTLPA